MNKDTLRGLIVGIILALIVGYGILYVRTLNMRVNMIENFLNKSIQAQQQRTAEPVKPQ